MSTYLGSTVSSKCNRMCGVHTSIMVSHLEKVMLRGIHEKTKEDTLSNVLYSILLRVQKRSYKRDLKPFLREMYRKRLEIGPEKERRRSEWINWNYDCEIYAFGKRLGEDFNDATIRQAFIDSSYIEVERKRRKELGIDLETVPLNLEDNSTLAEKGWEVMSNYIRVYLRNVYPYMFEECISDVHDYLTTDEMLSHLARNLGCEELILSQDFPVEQSTLSHTFKAVVGALVENQGKEHTEAFVRDFVVTQLVGKDVNELWNLVNPMGLLTAVAALTGRGPPEPRLLWKSGANTIMSLYWVGIYSDKRLLAKSPGESVTIAEEMAAREALKKLMKTEDSRSPLPMTEDLVLDYERRNASAKDIIRRHFEKTDTENRVESS